MVVNQASALICSVASPAVASLLFAVAMAANMHVSNLALRLF